MLANERDLLYAKLYKEASILIFKYFRCEIGSKVVGKKLRLGSGHKKNIFRLNMFYKVALLLGELLCNLS